MDRKTTEEIEDMNGDEKFDYFNELIHSDSILTQDEMNTYYEMEGPQKFINSRRIEIDGEKYDIYVHHFHNGEYPDEMNTDIIVAEAEGE